MCNVPKFFLSVRDVLCYRRLHNPDFIIFCAHIGQLKDAAICRSIVQTCFKTAQGNLSFNRVLHNADFRQFCAHLGQLKGADMCRSNVQTQNDYF